MWRGGAEVHEGTARANAAAAVSARPGPLRQVVAALPPGRVMRRWSSRYHLRVAYCPLSDGPGSFMIPARRTFITSLDRLTLPAMALEIVPSIDLRNGRVVR